ncbi:MAG: ABC transporter ATP-binding protein [Actinomycetota bacterium]|nr:ABC transporter ATP-binding protein [Actinomycetota bacterium]
MTDTAERSGRATNPISVQGLCKAYGGKNVVDGVDLEVRAGEVFGFLGPNGAGKTTTVDILTGCRPRTSGQVSVLGVDPAKDARKWRARLGVVPQSTGIFFEVTVGELLRQFASFYRDPLPVDEVIEMVGLTAKAGEKTQNLSGGQQRRLDVAIGVIGDPELLFLDEPTTGLDPEARREAWELVRYFGDRGTTTVLTTHYLDEVEALAQRAAIIVKGRIVEVGSIAELTDRGSREAHVAFTLPEPLRRVPLPHLRGHDAVRPDREGRVRIPTKEPSQVAFAMLSWAREHHVQELAGFRVVQPTLEDTYLALVRDQDEHTSTEGE